MPDQGDCKIEDYAFDFLEAYYSKQKKKSGILVNKQELTKRGAHADGLFSFRKDDNSIFAASLSVKQSDRLSSLLYRYKKKGLGKSRFLTAGILLAGTAYVGYATDLWWAQWVLPFFVALAGVIAHSVLQKRSLKRQLVSALDELKNFPADEQWLGISVSSLCFRSNPLAARLQELCERRGIGLITVGKRSRVTLRHAPRTATSRRGDFLSYYAAEETIRKTLSDQFMRVA